MGAANKVPGVSGGIVAFVMGFYETFIYSLQRFNSKSANLFFQGTLQKFLSIYKWTLSITAFSRDDNQLLQHL